jgi:hypothetical protein
MRKFDANQLRNVRNTYIRRHDALRELEAIKHRHVISEEWCQHKN